jgi:hypothetical protein
MNGNHQSPALHLLQFDALRKQLKMKPADVAMRFRELGATATPTKAFGEASDGQASKKYSVVLLPKVSAQVATWLPTIISREQYDS